MRCLALTAALLTPRFNLLAQRAVDGQNQNYRVMLVVPLVGAGTFADPKRPAFSPENATKLKAAGILSCQWQTSDDGKLAIVEYSARTRTPLLAMLKDPRLVIGFEKGSVKKDDVEKALRKYKKDFSVDPRSDKGREIK